MLSLETMPDKSHAMPDGLFALSNHRLMTLSGRDAVAFAQAQFMNDVTLLADGQWQWNGWLTPKGRVIALFALLRVNAETLWLVVSDTDAGQLAAALKRYVFRSKVAIAVRGDLHVAGHLGPPLVAAGPMASLEPAAPAAWSAELDMSAEGGPRAWYVLASPVAPSPAHEGQWAATDLRHGLPRLPASQIEHWTPQQLSLERLRGFSVKKGCYPGQEIVARTHFLGKVKRGLILVECTVPFEAGAELLAAGGALVTVVYSAPHGTGSVGLAVVPLDRDTTTTMSIHGHTTAEGSLLGGLDR